MRTYQFLRGTSARMHVHFIDTCAGWIDMQFRILEKGREIATLADENSEPVGTEAEIGAIHRLKLQMSAVFCPFPQMLAWLEAISLGLKHCAWQWDAEGFYCRLELSETQLTISGDNAGARRIWLAPRDIVSAIYPAFRRFAESRRYQPGEWEWRRYGEIFVECEGSGSNEDELRGRLMALDAAELERRLQRWQHVWVPAVDDIEEVAPGAYPNPDTSGEGSWLWPYVTSEWDGWDIARRRAHLREIFDWIDNGYGGTPLRSARSQIVERFLAEQQTAAA